MTGKQLKNSILQWAIQGKLVPQDPNDEPASVLLERIRAEKAQLIKEGKIKKDKNESIIYRGDDNSYYEKILSTGEVKCIDEEIPFEIPTSWSWARLASITSILGDGIHGTPEYDAIGTVYFINGNNLSNGSIEIKAGTKKVSEREAEKHKRLLCSTTVLVSINGTLGNVAFYNGENVILGKSACYFNLMGNIDKQYIKHILETEYFTEYAKNVATGSTIKNVPLAGMRNFLIPIPPITEQHRIILGMIRLAHFIDCYNDAQIKLDLLNNVLNEKLKKSVLQEAIQGKLVPQIAEEGTAQELLEQIKAEKQKLVKEGKLKKSALNDSVIFRSDDNKYYENNSGKISCIDDEIPFEIPSNWAWVRLDNICSFIHRGKSPKYSLVKKYPVIAQKCNQWSGFSIEKARFIEPKSLSSYKDDFFLQDKDLMWNSTGLGTLGRMALYYTALNPYELAVADSHVTIIRPLKQYIVPEFLYYYFASNTVQSVIEEKSDGSTKQKELATKTIQAYLVPLPPLAEQYRIVQQIKSVTSIMSR